MSSAMHRHRIWLNPVVKSIFPHSLPDWSVPWRCVCLPLLCSSLWLRKAFVVDVGDLTFLFDLRCSLFNRPSFTFVHLSVQSEQSSLRVAAVNRLEELVSDTVKCVFLAVHFRVRFKICAQAKLLSNVRLS